MHCCYLLLGCDCLISGASSNSVWAVKLPQATLWPVRGSIGGSGTSFLPYLWPQCSLCLGTFCLAHFLSSLAFMVLKGAWNLHYSSLSYLIVDWSFALSSLFPLASQGAKWLPALLGSDWVLEWWKKREKTILGFLRINALCIRHLFLEVLIFVVWYFYPDTLWPSWDSHCNSPSPLAAKPLPAL